VDGLPLYAVHGTFAQPLANGVAESRRASGCGVMGVFSLAHHAQPARGLPVAVALGSVVVGTAGWVVAGRARFVAATGPKWRQLLVYDDSSARAYRLGRGGLA